MVDRKCIGLKGASVTGHNFGNKLRNALAIGQASLAEN